MIRRAAPEDVPAMVEMGRCFHAEAKFELVGPFDPASFAASIEQWLDTDSVLLLVAEIDGEVVGMTCAVLMPLYFNRAWLMGQELFWWVKPGHRNGLGHDLKAALESEAAAAGVRTWGMAANANLRPQVLERFYRSQGFAPVERTYMKRV